MGNFKSTILLWKHILCNYNIMFNMFTPTKQDQVTQAYFEIWPIEVGIGVKNISSVDFKIFVFLYIP